ncbi:hypothetical protein [Humibacter sp. RRB41]|uniref:hypothetical protein n=1 Tax=Humibacter sp. RRB41 TaxID=2919946 RepID=UPI001FAAC2B6|nr:hypothetical protein [Humibacter sp. RRB41]
MAPSSGAAGLTARRSVGEAEHWLRTRLFAPGPGSTAPSTLRGKGVLAGLLVVVGTLIGAFHIPPSQWGILWAEDGSVFLHGAWSPATAFDLFQPYQGYLHVAPRLVAMVIGATVPASAVATGFTIAACAVVALLGTFVFFAVRDRFVSVAIAALVWLAFVGLPVGVPETNGNLANLHWYFLAAAAVALLSRTPSRLMRVSGTVIVVLAILSDPLSLYLLPLAAVRLFVYPEPASKLRAGIFAAAYVVQLTFVVLAPHMGGTRASVTSTIPTPGNLLDLWVRRAPELTTMGTRVTAYVVAHFQPLDIYLVIIVVGVLVASIALWARQRVWSLTFIVLSIALYGFSEFFAWTDLAASGLTFGLRYAVAPALLFVIGALSGLDQLIARSGRRPVRVAAVAVVIVIALVASASSIDTADGREGSPTFASQLAAAHTTCDVEGAKTFTAQFAPHWLHELPCAGLRAR